MVATRTIFAFLGLFLMIRIMGKQSLSQLTLFDYVVGITIGGIASFISVEFEEPIPGITALFIWGLLAVAMAWLSLKSVTIRKWLNGEPTVLIRDGQIIDKNLGTSRYSVDELLMQLRLKDVFNLADVEVAILEPNGRLSILKKSETLPLTPRSLDIPVAERGMPSVLVEDGVVMKDTLQHLGYDEEWLTSALQEQGVKAPRDVMLAQLDGYGNLYVDLKGSGDDRPYPPQTEKQLAADLDVLGADLSMFALETDDVKARQLFSRLAGRVREVKKRVAPLILH